MNRSLLASTPRWWFTLALLLTAALTLRVVVMATVPLLPEEAYYWMYAQHPNLSYYDHPPMVAWVIALGTVLFGDTEFGVRIVGSILMGTASVFMFLSGRIWFGTRAALIAAATLIVLPVYFATGAVAREETGEETGTVTNSNDDA